MSESLPVGANGLGSDRQYEFSASENDVFRQLAGWMNVTGGGLLLVGLLQLGLTAATLGSIGDDDPQLALRPVRAALGGQVMSGLLMAIVFTCLAYWVRQSARSLRAVVATQGHDIDHTMNAVRHLRASFSAMFYLLSATLVTLFLWTCFGSLLSHLLP